MRRNIEVLLLVLLGIAVAAVTSYYYPVGGDEYHHMIVVKEVVSGDPDFSAPLEVIPFWYPLTWHLMAAAVFSVTGSIWAIKAMQLLLGVLVILLSYKLFSDLGVPRRIKNYSVIFLALYSGWIIHSARLYIDILVAVMVPLTLILYFRYHKDPSRKNCAFLALSLIITSFTHVHAVFLFPALLLAELVYEHRVKLRTWAIFILSSLPFLAWWSRNNFLEQSQLSPAVNSIFNLKWWFFFSLPKIFVYGIWLGVPNADEAYFRAALFSNLPTVFGINPLWLWAIPAGFLSMIMLAGLFYLMLHREKLGVYLLIIGGLFLLPFFAKGFIRIFFVPSLVVLAYIFGTGWWWIEMEFKKLHMRKVAHSFILILLIVFAFQGPVMATHIHKEKAEIEELAEYAKKMIPEDAKVYTPVEYTRNRLYLERELIADNTITVTKLSENPNKLDGYYMYIDSWMFKNNRLNHEEQLALDTLVRTPCVKLVSELAIEDSWEKIYRIECS